MININSATIHLNAFSTFDNRVQQDATVAIAEHNYRGENKDAASSGVKVSVSNEARERLAKEQSAAGQQLKDELKQPSAEQTEQSGNDTEFLDELIEQVQQQIKEIQQKLRAHSNEGSKEAEQERKMLESQLMSLNATLLNLLGKKLSALEQGAS